MYSLSLSLVGLLFTGILVFNSFSAQRNVDFVMSAVVSAYFIYCHVIPYFENSLKIFEVLTTVLLLIGAAVGGMIGLLIPQTTCGFILGFLIGLIIDATTYGFFANRGDTVLSIAIFFVTTVIFLVLSLKQEYQLVCSILRTSLTIGMVFALSVDFLLQGGLLVWIGNVVRLTQYNNQLCFWDCFIPQLLAVWIVATLIILILYMYQAGMLQKFCYSTRRNGSRYGNYEPVATNTSSSGAGGGGTHKQRTFTYPDTLEYNFFDPDAIPAILQPYSDVVFTEVQRIAAQYGFQVDSSRNQAEHVLMMLTNEIEKTDYGNYLKPVVRLHNKLFSNYMKWCYHIGTTPLSFHMYKKRQSYSTLYTDHGHGNYSTVDDEIGNDAEATETNYDKLIDDILLWLLIWGEAGNMKHMPESLCYLFHKTLTDKRYFLSLSDSREMYPGYYLDMVVTPIYEVIQTGLSKAGDHNQKKTYDDFNEFFWSPKCLKFRIIDSSPAASGNGADIERRGDISPTFEDTPSEHKNVVTPIQLHVAIGLNQAPKTYIEKRSWFHPLLNLHRVFEWHCVTFTILASWAFSNQLVWDLSYTLKIGSFVFWEIGALTLIWTSLEVWLLIPNATMPGPSKAGYLIRLIAGYTLLCYQTIYYHWSFPTSAQNVPSNLATPFSDAASTNTMESIGDVNFWWWQYVWISVIGLSIYFLESFMCWFPFITSALLKNKNEFVQALLNICWPLSQLFIGKNVHVSQKEVYRYIFFWITLILFKFFFSYHFIVFPVTVPSLELYDDYVNFGEVSFVKTAILFFVWWFPHFLVYLIDLSIWYSLWSSLVGGFVALVDRQGAVRDDKSFRTHFMKGPIAFCQKIMPSNMRVSSLSRTIGPASTASIGNLTVAQLGVMEKSSPGGKRSISGSKESNGASTAASTPSTGGGAGGGRCNASSNIPKTVKSSADLTSMSSYQTYQPPVTSGNSNSHSNSNSMNSEPSLEIGMSDYNKLKESISTAMSLTSDVGQRWTIFATVWNEIILRLRHTDHINEFEKENFIFSTFNWLSKPVYLPLFQTAGCIENAIFAFREASVAFHEEEDPVKKINIIENFNNTSMDLSMKEAVNEAWELTGWLLLKFMGPLHSDDLTKILETMEVWSFSSTGDLFSKLNSENLNRLVLHHLASIAAILKPAVAKRRKANVVTKEVLDNSSKRDNGDDSKNQAQPNNASVSTSIKPKATSSAGMKKSVSTGFLSSLSHLTDDATTALLEPPKAGVASNTSVATAALSKSNHVNKTNQGFTKLQPFRKTVVLHDMVRDKVREELRSFLSGLRTTLRASKETLTTPARDIIDRITFILSLESGFLWNDMYASMQLDELAKDSNVQGALNKLVGLLKLRQTQVDTLSPEPSRRLNFFINSLFMDMPLVPQTRYVKDFTCLTPFYSEDVLLSKDDLESKNSDGVSTLLYLQTLYKKDWINFLERLKLTDDLQAFHKDYLQETRMWASMRAQTLFRTVDGMMYSEAATRLICQLEQLTLNETEIFSKLKFNYVVACQIYGSMKKTMDPKAEDIEFMMQRHPNLRVAYIDTVRANRDGDNTYYSVLIKHDPAAVHKTSNKYGIKEVYRIKLAGNPVLGEGKPENQNHAIVFSRGRYLQAIDMNQEGYFEESLKMRNLLQEFDSGCSILGFREHIFTGSVSSVANYMALQELSFVTLGQRCLAQPLCIRQHYGHPDLFDKFFTMTEGGMSKASRGINLSEDVFAGFNATIRGHTVGFKEYAQVGKGRDVGLQQTYKFEAKLSQGNAEQSLSRDLGRVCDRLDFFRLMSFYYGGIGHYIANTMVMFTLVIVVYFMLGLAIFGEEGVNSRPMHPEGVLQLLMAGLGLLQTMPLIVTLTVEKGIISAITEIAYMFLSGGPLYFIFHIQTKCYYFSQTLMTGGAAYRPTGRGFVIRHSPFDENFRFFATSHIYLGFELMLALILFGVHTKSTQYPGLTWSLWLTVVSFMFGPFWFNPVTFEWEKLIEDYTNWIRWMTETGGSSELSWSVWWREENSFYKDLSFSWKCVIFVQKCLVWVIISIGLFQARFFHDTDEQGKFLSLLSLYFIFMIGHWILSKLERSLTYAIRRFASLTLSTTIACCVFYFFISHTLYIRHTIAFYYFVSACGAFCLLCGFQQVQYLYKFHDYLVGHTLFLVLGLMTAFQVGYLQTWLLYHNALSSGVVIEDILKHARKTKEKGHNEEEEIALLKAQVLQQEKVVQQLVASLGSTPSASSAGSASAAVAASRPHLHVSNVGSGASVGSGAHYAGFDERSNLLSGVHGKSSSSAAAAAVTHAAASGSVNSASPSGVAKSYGSTSTSTNASPTIPSAPKVMAVPSEDMSFITESIPILPKMASFVKVDNTPTQVWTSVAMPVPFASGSSPDRSNKVPSASSTPRAATAPATLLSTESSDKKPPSVSMSSSNSNIAKPLASSVDTGVASLNKASSSQMPQSASSSTSLPAAVAKQTFTFAQPQKFPSRDPLPKPTEE